MVIAIPILVRTAEAAQQLERLRYPAPPADLPPPGGAALAEPSAPPEVQEKRRKLSHNQIERRRRTRINNNLAEMQGHPSPHP